MLAARVSRTSCGSTSLSKRVFPSSPARRPAVLTPRSAVISSSSSSSSAASSSRRLVKMALIPSVSLAEDLARPAFSRANQPPGLFLGLAHAALSIASLLGAPRRRGGRGRRPPAGSGTARRARLPRSRRAGKTRCARSRLLDQDFSGLADLGGQGRAQRGGRPPRAAGPPALGAGPAAPAACEPPGCGARRIGEDVQEGEAAIRHQVRLRWNMASLSVGKPAIRSAPSMIPGRRSRSSAQRPHCVGPAMTALHALQDQIVARLHADR